jgi:hypothetical protein
VKKTIIVAALCAMATTGVGLVSHAPATASATSSSVTVRHCQVLRTLPTYVYRYQGATVYMPSGAARYREVVVDGLRGDNLQRVCKAQVNQQVRSNGAPAPVVNVLRELSYG